MVFELNTTLCVLESKAAVCVCVCAGGVLMGIGFLSQPVHNVVLYKTAGAGRRGLSMYRSAEAPLSKAG